MLICPNCNAEFESGKFCKKCGTQLIDKTAGPSHCANCGAELEPGALFCGECGAKVQTQSQSCTCPNCGTEVKAGKKFCPNCGTKIESGSSDSDLKEALDIISGLNGKRKDIPTGLKMLQNVAAQGNADAYFWLGNFFCNGVGREFGYEADPHTAYNYYKKAADMDSAQGWDELGRCYYYGDGVAENYAEAFRCFKKAESLGFYSWFMMGLCYYFGRGVDQDYRSAYSMFKKEVEGGTEANDAYVFLAACYYYGNGVQQDYNEAFKYFKKAEEAEDIQAYLFLGKCYFLGLGTDSNLSLALTNFEKARDLANSDESYFWLGRVYNDLENYKESIKCFEIAEQNDFTAALYWLGIMYYFGDGVPEDKIKAFSYFKRSVDADDDTSLWWLGFCYENGKGCQEDPVMAFHLYKKGHEKGDNKCTHRLGLLYFYGYGCAKDEQYGRQLIQNAANNGNESAQKWLKEN